MISWPSNWFTSTLLLREWYDSVYSAVSRGRKIRKDFNCIVIDENLSTKNKYFYRQKSGKIKGVDVRFSDSYKKKDKPGKVK